ncbi:MAG: crossover junction endodeoxyribonuclease RuvC [Clostridiales bacterium]|nr:crossover junction endodeoxyribonuclease RuvC [Clostridiales bacterium]MBR3842336.1 crossover junction endodeoxyribonuclease RuvC [Christensenellaceae bacterium]
MVILGIDPGLAIVGYGLINYDNVKMKLIDYGAILTPAGMKIPERLDIIYDSMTELIKKYKPDAIAFEELFFAKNVKTAIAVAQARGAAVTAAYKQTKELYEYTPLQIKQAMTGYGRADKNQIQQMVKLLLGLKEIPKPDDAADAVAVAMTHAQSLHFGQDFRM